MIRRAHYRNASRTLERLLALGVVPVINENDAVATEEIRFGDNDRLAALVAHLVQADALVLLSDVDGLYDGDPRRPGVQLVAGGARRRATWPASGSVARRRLGTGGMASKLDAARIAAGAGVPVLLAAAEAVGPALAGEPVGTAFPPPPAVPRPASSGSATRPRRGAGWCSMRARWRRWSAGAPRCCPRG